LGDWKLNRVAQIHDHVVGRLIEFGHGDGLTFGRGLPALIGVEYPSPSGEAAVEGAVDDVGRAGPRTVAGDVRAGGLTLSVGRLGQDTDEECRTECPCV